MSDTTTVRNMWYIGLVVARGLLLRLYDLSTRPPHTLARQHGPRVVVRAPMDDDVAPGHVAVLTMPRNPRMQMVAGSLVSLRCYQERGRHSAASLRTGGLTAPPRGPAAPASALVPARPGPPRHSPSG